MTFVHRFGAACLLVQCLAAVQAAPLLIVNYSKEPTEFASARAGQLALDHSVITDFIAPQLTGKSVLIMPGMSSYQLLMTSKPILTEFVENGGYLWLNLAGSGGCAPDAAPGGVSFVAWNCNSAPHDQETIASPTHSYFTGAFSPAAKPLTAADFANWQTTDAGHLDNIPANAKVLLSNAKGPALVEYGVGKGWVVVSTLTYGWATGGARGAALDNMLLYAAAQVRDSAAPMGPPPPEAGAVPEPGGLLLSATGVAAIACGRASKGR
ncbi:MAG TPA: hypothetical protein VER03_09760 [Bryobacteraceae bacterium]|nr:hypothetical protein [Bryobacteraceae bacterium]